MIKYVATIYLDADVEFPLDMLRLDQCYPVEEIHAYTSNQPRTIQIERIVDVAWIKDSAAFNVERWKSLGVYVLYVDKHKFNKTHGMWNQGTQVFRDYHRT